MQTPDSFDSSDPAAPGRRRFLQALCALGAVGLAGCGSNDGTTTGTATPAGTSTSTGTPTRTGATTATGADPTDTPTRTPTRTPPDVNPIAPVTPNAVGHPPDDAEVLFGGDVDTLEKFESRGGGEAPWTVSEDSSHFRVDVGTGDIVTQADVGDCHLHLEFSPPEETDDTGQAKGNSGIKMMTRYEFQVLNNVGNDSDGDSLAGAIYGQSAPLVDPYRSPTEWQVYDIIWRGPRFEDGEVATPGRGTAFLNGVLVQAHRNLRGVTPPNSFGPYDPHPREQPILFQDHGDSAVSYRNVWYRSLPDEDAVVTNTEPALQPEYDDELQESAYAPDLTSPARAVDPGAAFRNPPSDATVLLGEDGSLDGWESAGGGTPGWREEDGYIVVEPEAGNVRTEEAFGDCQLHAEFRIPADVDGVGRNRGNSGLLLADRYEFQILDNFENVSAHDRWVGAYTGQAPPLASPVRPPGEWQAIDVVWEGPRFSDGRLDRPARLTALLNGVVVQNRLYLNGPNTGGSLDTYESHPHDAPLGLQEHGDPVHFRNVWYRDID